MLKVTSFPCSCRVLNPKEFDWRGEGVVTCVSTWSQIQGIQETYNVHIALSTCHSFVDAAAAASTQKTKQAIYHFPALSVSSRTARSVIKPPPPPPFNICARMSEQQKTKTNRKYHWSLFTEDPHLEQGSLLHRLVVQVVIIKSPQGTDIGHDNAIVRTSQHY